MAPFAGPSPEAVYEMLRSRSRLELPIAMGGPGGPTLAVGVLDDDWCLYRYRVDEAAFTEFARARDVAGEPLYPEHRMRFLVPGEVLLRCPTRAEFVEGYAALEITFDRSYRALVRPRTDARTPGASWWSRLWARRER